MVLTLPPHVCACIDQLEQAGFEAWAVGACVICCVASSRTIMT